MKDNNLAIVIEDQGEDEIKGLKIIDVTLMDKGQDEVLLVKVVLDRLAAELQKFSFRTLQQQQYLEHVAVHLVDFKEFLDRIKPCPLRFTVCKALNQFLEQGIRF